MFISQAQAITFFAGLGRRYPNIHKVLGANLAEGSLTDADGLATKADPRGHFDLFESETADLSQTFVIIQPLVQ